jgi:hypothetical protein
LASKINWKELLEKTASYRTNWELNAHPKTINQIMNLPEIGIDKYTRDAAEPADIFYERPAAGQVYGEGLRYLNGENAKEFAKNVGKHIPDATFELNGDGEDDIDNWRVVRKAIIKKILGMETGGKKYVVNIESDPQKRYFRNKDHGYLDDRTLGTSYFGGLPINAQAYAGSVNKPSVPEDTGLLEAIQQYQDLDNKNFTGKGDKMKYTPKPEILKQQESLHAKFPKLQKYLDESYY